MMTLAAIAGRTAGARQDAAGCGDDPEPDISELVDTLANRIGRAEPSIAWRRSQRRAGTVGAARAAAGRPLPARLARALAAAVAAAARPEPIETVALLPDHPPALVHLARRAPARRARRRAGAGLRRMVEARRRADGGAGLFPGRGRGRRALLDLPHRRRRGSRDRRRIAGSCTASSDEGPRYAELQVTTHFRFLRGASSAEELFATAACSASRRSAVADRNSPRRHRPRA